MGLGMAGMGSILVGCGCGVAATLFFWLHLPGKRIAPGGDWWGIKAQSFLPGAAGHSTSCPA